MKNIHILDINFLNYQDAIACFLVETSDGLVLVESGPYSTFYHLENRLQEKGFKLDDIKHVLLTHIHLDHAGAAWALAKHGAKIYVHPFGAKHLEKPEKLINSAKRIYKDDMDRLWGEMKPVPSHQIREIQHQEEIIIGDTTWKAWHTPGHAVHHIAWQLEESVFTGDVAGVKINDGPVVPPCPPPDINLEDWKKSIELIKRIHPKALYLTHFGKVEHENIDSHLDTLEKNLHNWANWIKPYWEAGEKAENLTPLFQKYVRQQLIDAQVNEEGLERYEAANPSWMSVAGLMRYWRKKYESKH